MKLTEKFSSRKCKTRRGQFILKTFATLVLLLSASLSSHAGEFQWFPQGDGISFSDPGNWYDFSDGAVFHNPSGPPGANDTAQIISSATVTAANGAVNLLKGTGTAKFTLNGPFSAGTVEGGGMTLAGSGQLTAQTVKDFLTIVGGRMVANNYSARSLSVTSGGSLVIKSSVQSTELPSAFGVFVDSGATLDVAGQASDVAGGIQGGAQATVASLANLNTSQDTLSVAGFGSSLRILGNSQIRAGSLDVSGGAKVNVGGAMSFEGANSRGTSTSASSAWKHLGTVINAAGGVVIGAGSGKYTVQLSGGAKLTSAAGVVLGNAAGAEGNLSLDSASDVDLGKSSLVVGDRGRGILSVDSDSTLLARDLIIGKSPADNRMTAAGKNTILGVLTELVIGNGGRGNVLLQGGVFANVERLVVGRASLADNQVIVEGIGTLLSGAGRIDVGELNGRGTFELRNAAEAKPAGGLSVGIYDGSIGNLSVHDAGQITTTNTAIFGGGAASTCAVTIWDGGKLTAYDAILIFAKPSGSSAVEVKGDSLGLSPTLMQALKEIDVGFAHDAAGPTLLRVSNGGFVAAGKVLSVGANGVLDATSGIVKVGDTDFPPPGTVRVGSGGLLEGSGRVQGTIEVLSGGVVAPGSSPGALTIQGNYNQKPGARLEIEIAGTTAGTAYDQLHVTGAATIPGGTLAIKFSNGFSPRNGQSYTFLQADSGLTGSFTNVQVTGVAPGFIYSLITNNSGGISLQAGNDGVATSAPRLDIARSGASVVVSWPAPGNWILESSAKLSTGWQPVNAIPVNAGDHFSITLPTTAPATFFRLRQ